MAARERLAGQRAALVRSDLGEFDPPVGFTEAALRVIGVPTVEACFTKRPAEARREPTCAIGADVARRSRGGRPSGARHRRAQRPCPRRVRTRGRRPGRSRRPHLPARSRGRRFLHPTALLRDEIVAALPEATLVETEFEPVVGALLLGFDRLDGQLDVDALRLSLPLRRAVPNVGRWHGGARYLGWLTRGRRTRWLNQPAPSPKPH